jgi:hypothetical protein
MDLPSSQVQVEKYPLGTHATPVPGRLRSQLSYISGERILLHFLKCVSTRRMRYLLWTLTVARDSQCPGHLEDLRAAHIPLAQSGHAHVAALPVRSAQGPQSEFAGAALAAEILANCLAQKF